MPDLGKYAQAVLLSYTVSLALIGLLVLFSVLRARRVRRDLDKIEERNKNHG